MRAVVRLAGAPVRMLLIALVRAYRATFRGAFGGRCRFHPSCSAYAEEAVRAHGAIRGTALAVWRVLRCQPLSAGGPDPVPPRPSYDGVTQGRA